MMSQPISATLPLLAGSPWLTQGAYGDAGNLELVAPAIDDGFWVFWFNADPVDHQQGAARGCWSGGLHVFAGHPVQAARITQVVAGPRFLEALALSHGALHRLYWTPDDGFVHAGRIAADIADTSAVVEHGAALHLDARRTDGSLLRLTDDLADYPAVTWAESLGTAGEWSTSALGLRLDDPPFAGLGAHALSAARTTLDGGRTDVVLAIGDGLLHLHGDGTTWSDPTRIVSRVWTSPDTPDAPVHRR